MTGCGAAMTRAIEHRRQLLALIPEVGGTAACATLQAADDVMVATPTPRTLAGSDAMLRGPEVPAIRRHDGWDRQGTGHAC